MYLDPQKEICLTLFIKKPMLSSIIVFIKRPYRLDYACQKDFWQFLDEKGLCVLDMISFSQIKGNIGYQGYKKKIN